LAGDPELAEIVEMFVAEMPDRIANFRNLFNDRKSEELRRAAHQLKGAAGSYGFDSITRAAARLEDAVKTSRLEAEIHQAIEELTDLCQSARAGTGD
jgi:HPt (histidine-containing phosphotransfer) domain-containing protein